MVKFNNFPLTFRPKPVFYFTAGNGYCVSEPGHAGFRDKNKLFLLRGYFFAITAIFPHITKTKDE